MLKFSADNEACALFMRVAKNRWRNYMCINIATLEKERRRMRNAQQLTSIENAITAQKKKRWNG